MRPAQQGFVLAKYAAEDLKLTHVLILADEQQAEFIHGADAFARQFAQMRDGKGKTESMRFGKDVKWDELAKRLVARQPFGALLFAGTARDWLELRRAHRFTVPVLFAGDDSDAANLEPDAGSEPIYCATAFAADPAAPRRGVHSEIPGRVQGTARRGRGARLRALELYAAALKEISPTFTVDKLAAARARHEGFSGARRPTHRDGGAVRAPAAVRGAAHRHRACSTKTVRADRAAVAS